MMNQEPSERAIPPRRVTPLAVTPVREINPNRLIFHIQPYQGIEIQFQAKVPGPRLQLQPVNMRFSYGEEVLPEDDAEKHVEGHFSDGLETLPR